MELFCIFYLLFHKTRDIKLLWTIWDANANFFYYAVYTESNMNGVECRMSVDKP